MVKILVAAAILSVINVTVWTHPVLVAIERYAGARSSSYTGPIAGIAEEKVNRVVLKVIDDISHDRFDAAIDNGLTCETAATWLCTNRTTIDPVVVTSPTTWKGPAGRFCVARCTATGDVYAFVIFVNGGAE